MKICLESTRYLAKFLFVFKISVIWIICRCCRIILIIAIFIVNINLCKFHLTFRIITDNKLAFPTKSQILNARIFWFRVYVCKISVIRNAKYSIPSIIFHYFYLFILLSSYFKLLILFWGHKIIHISNYFHANTGTSFYLTIRRKMTLTVN